MRKLFVFLCLLSGCDNDIENKYIVKSIRVDSAFVVTIEMKDIKADTSFIITKPEYGCQIHFEEGDTLTIESIEDIL